MDKGIKEILFIKFRNRRDVDVEFRVIKELFVKGNESRVAEEVLQALTGKISLTNFEFAFEVKLIVRLTVSPVYLLVV